MFFYNKGIAWLIIFTIKKLKKIKLNNLKFLVTFTFNKPMYFSIKVNTKTTNINFNSF